MVSSINSVMINDILLLVGAFGYVGLIILIAMLLKSKGLITGFIARKIVHLFAGFSVFIVPFLSIPHLSLIVSLTVLVIIRISGPHNAGAPVFEMMAEKDEREKGYLSGPFSYALAINILVFIFAFMPQWFYFPASAILVMMISDTLAAFVGKKYGKHKIILKYTKTERTFEGSFALFISAFILSAFSFSFFGALMPYSAGYSLNYFWIFIISLLMAFDSTIIELLSPSNLDDLLMPITACFLTFAITLLFFPGSIL